MRRRVTRDVSEARGVSEAACAATRSERDGSSASELTILMAEQYKRRNIMSLRECSLASVGKILTVGASKSDTDRECVGASASKATNECIRVLRVVLEC